MSKQLAEFFNNIYTTDKDINVFSKKNLSSEVEFKLFPYQVSSVLKMIEILINNQHKIVIKSSDTGTGKSYMVAAVCKELERKPIIICPKSIMYTWVSVCNYIDVVPLDIVNYETIKHAKSYKTMKIDGEIKYPFKNRKESTYLRIEEGEFVWTLPKNAIIIIDEAHKCKNSASENGRFLKSLKSVMNAGIPVILLSATLCEKIKDMKLIFYLLGIIEDTREFNGYLKDMNTKYPDLRVRKKDFINERGLNKKEYEIAKENAEAMRVYREIKDHSSRIRIKDLGDNFPSNQWCAQLFVADETDDIVDMYDQLTEHMKALKEKNNNCVLGEIVKLKQEIELRKVPIFIEQANEFLDQGKSVIIFVNFLETMQVISDELNIICKIYGGNKKYGVQDIEARNECIRSFQNNEEKIIICQMRAGNVGISLHDLSGDHPRAVLLNYPDTASDLIQALGRAPRAGAKSPVIQRIVLVANVPYEEKIKKNIDRRMINISTINDNDLEFYKYKVMKKKQDIVEI